jgi:hypothetical protein
MMFVRLPFYHAERSASTLPALTQEALKNIERTRVIPACVSNMSYSIKIPVGPLLYLEELLGVLLV